MVDIILGYNKTARFKLNEDEWTFSLPDIQEIFHGIATFQMDGLIEKGVYARFHRHCRSGIWFEFYRSQPKDIAFGV